MVCYDHSPNQVREINGEVNKAAAAVDKRLTAATEQQQKSEAMKERATSQYKDWETGWSEEYGKQPVLEDV